MQTPNTDEGTASNLRLHALHSIAHDRLQLGHTSTRAHDRAATRAYSFARVRPHRASRCRVKAGNCGGALRPSGTSVQRGAPGAHQLSSVRFAGAKPLKPQPRWARRATSHAPPEAEENVDANETNQWRLCSTCRKPIPFGSRYYQCSVSTCNRSRLPLFFCSVGCWDAHVPTLRHRDAWAEESTAPTREQAEREQQTEASEPTATRAESSSSSSSVVDAKTGAHPVRRVVSGGHPEPAAERDVLVVMSKLKQHIRTSSGMNTSDAVSAVLSDHLRALCEAAVDHARLEGRKTVMDRDFAAVIDQAAGRTRSERG